MATMEFCLCKQALLKVYITSSIFPIVNDYFSTVRMTIFRASLKYFYAAFMLPFLPDLHQLETN